MVDDAPETTDSRAETHMARMSSLAALRNTRRGPEVTENANLWEPEDGADFSSRELVEIGNSPRFSRRLASM